MESKLNIAGSRSQFLAALENWARNTKPEDFNVLKSSESRTPFICLMRQLEESYGRLPPKAKLLLVKNEAKSRWDEQIAQLRDTRDAAFFLTHLRLWATEWQRQIQAAEEKHNQKQAWKRKLLWFWAS